MVQTAASGAKRIGGQQVLRASSRAHGPKRSTWMRRTRAPCLLSRSIVTVHGGTSECVLQNTHEEEK